MNHSKPIVVVLDDWEGRWAASPGVDRLRSQAEVRIFPDRLLGVGELAQAAGDAAVLVLNRERTRVDTAFLAALPELHTIVNTGAGLNHVNRAAVEARGVRIVTTGGRSRAVVEQTFALMLGAVKQLPQLDRGLRCGRFPEQPLVGDLYGKRLGLAGLGLIGEQVARIASAFGMVVTAWSPHLSEEKAAELGIARAESLLQLAGSSDVFSLHLRLVPETRGVVSADVIAALPRGALFVNTARAELVDTQALLARAESGELILALDVFDDEPDIDPRYRQLPGALSPHVGWKSEGTWDEFVRLGVERILEVLPALDSPMASVLQRTPDSAR
jgi:phosphoglycerate dehydrogenase-like enzyme